MYTIKYPVKFFPDLLLNLTTYKNLVILVSNDNNQGVVSYVWLCFPCLKERPDMADAVKSKSVLPTGYPLYSPFVVE